MPERPALDSAILEECVPAWRRSERILKARRKASDKVPPISRTVDSILRSHGIGVRTDFDSLAIYAAYVSAIRDRARSYGRGVAA